MTTDLSPRPAIDPKTLARLLGVHGETLKVWIKLGKVPQPVRLGHRTLRWPADVVDQILQRGAR